MNILRQMLKSLFSPKDISSFRFQGIGKTILYVFFLMIIASIPSAFFMATTTTQTVSQVQQVLNEEGIPDFQLEKGVLVSNLTEPYVREENGAVFIIDPQEKVTQEEIASFENGIVLAKRSLFVINDGIQQFRYRDFGNISITKQEIEQIVVNMSSMLPLIITVIILLSYLFHAAMKFIGITILAAVGILLRNKLQVKAPYRNLWIMSAYAVTLPTLFFAFMEIFHFTIPFAFTIYWVTAITILYLAVRKIPKPRNTQ